MFKNKKKFMIPVLSLILVVAMAGTAMAVTNDGYPDFWWSGQLGVNSTSSWDSNETRFIQEFMNENQAAGLVVDGDYGSNTRSAVIYFQNAEGITADGIVGNDTWSEMQDKLEPNPLKLQSSSGRWYYAHSITGDTVPYRHYQNGDWYVIVNSSFYRFN